MPLSLRTMIVRLPRRFSPRISTTPSTSAITAGSFGFRASKISVTRGRPPVMSLIPDASRGVLATTVPAAIVWPFVDFDVSSFRQVVDVQRFAVAIFEHDLRVQITLVIGDDSCVRDHRGPFRRASFRLRRYLRKRTRPETSARIGILCGSHWQRTAPALTSWFSLTISTAPVGTSYFSSSRPFGSRMRDFAVSGQHDRSVLLRWSRTACG